MYDGNQKTAPDGTLQYDFMQMVGQSVNRYLQFKRPGYKVPTPKSHLVHLLEAVPNLDPDYVEVLFSFLFLLLCFLVLIFFLFLSFFHSGLLL